VLTVYNAQCWQIAVVSGLVFVTLQCLKAVDLLSLFGFSPMSTISPENFVDLCPSLVLQLDSHVCALHSHGGDDEQHHHRQHHHHHHDEHSQSVDKELPKWQSGAGMYCNVKLIRYCITKRFVELLGRQVQCCLQVKLCDPCLSAFGVSHNKGAVYIHASFKLCMTEFAENK